MTHPWYHTTSIYQIYPRSFYDSNGDGIGDLQGIIQKLDHIRDLGFETIWVSPFFSSPQSDFGYDISDYWDIAPEYGTMRDAVQLIEEVHQRGMRIIFDMVMNHTSVEHAWFKESRSSRDNPKADWYIWRDKPNNWNSMVGGSGWHYAQERGQYFWSSFLPFQPDLNYRNPEVKNAMLEVVRFWLGKGVDGFRLDIFNVLYKDAKFRNNPFSVKAIPTEDDPSGFFQEAKYTLNQPESFEFAKELRATCDEFGEKVLLGEVSGDRATIRKYLGDDDNNGLGLIFDFGMLDIEFNAYHFQWLIEKVERHFPEPFMPVYVFSNHDRRRSASRLKGDLRKAKLLAMLQLTVRGVPCFYYGEEIGMMDFPMPYATALDLLAHKYKIYPRFLLEKVLKQHVNRDEFRTPMQWDQTKHAGFSSADKTWLPVHHNYENINVKTAERDNASLLRAIHQLLFIRKTERAMREGALEFIEHLPYGVLGYRRIFEDRKLAVYLNFTEQDKQIEFGEVERYFKLSQTADKILHGLDGIIVHEH